MTHTLVLTDRQASELAEAARLPVETGGVLIASIGDGVMMGGQVGVSDHIAVGAHSRIAASSGVIRDVAEREAVGRYPALPIRQWHRQTIVLSRLTHTERRRYDRTS